MPTSQPKAKTIWIIAALLLVIFLAGGAWLFFQSKAKAEAARIRQENLKQAEATARNFLEAMAAKDLEKAFSYAKISEAERRQIVWENKNKPDFQQVNIKLESVGPATFAPDNDKRILVPVTVSVNLGGNNRKKSQKLPLEYDSSRQCWLIVPDK